MTRYSIEPGTRKYIEEYAFLSFARKYKKQLLDTGLNASKKVEFHKAGESIENKIADAITKSSNDNIEKEEPVEEIIIPPEKREEMLTEKSIITMEHYNISKLLNDSTVKNLLQNKWVEVNDLSSARRSVNKNIRFKTSVRRSDLYDYSDAYIVVKVAIDLLAAGANENDKAEKDVAFKNNAQFRLCI